MSLPAPSLRLFTPSRNVILECSEDRWAGTAAGRAPGSAHHQWQASAPGVGMPVDARDGLLIGAGLTLAGAATLFYKRKQTTAFKLAYFLTWPTRGSAVLLSCMPEREDMYKARRCRAGGHGIPWVMAPRNDRDAQYGTCTVFFRLLVCMGVGDGDWNKAPAGPHASTAVRRPSHACQQRSPDDATRGCTPDRDSKPTTF